MIVLGVDPSSVATGWAILDGDSRGAKALSYGILKASSRESLPSRLLKIHEGLFEILSAANPEILVIESAFLARNVKTAFTLGQVRGVILLAAMQRGVPVEEYSPLEIKRSAVGYGAAKKDQMIRMMQRLLGLDTAPRDDEADALATAWCHLARAARPVSLAGAR